jgi:microcin C transport system substrate-binding protein
MPREQKGDQIMTFRLLALGALLTFSGWTLVAQTTAAADKRPNFATPTVADPTLKVDGVPEKVTWYTSQPGVWGSPRAKQGGTFHSFIDEFPSTFRTVGPNSNGSARSLFLTTPSLVEINGETKQFLPALATHWAYAADGKTMYFKLNEKAKWSDGNPVTADDYVFMVRMMKSPDIQDPYSNDYFTTQIVDVKKLGPWLISVTANAPMGQDDLLYNLSISPRPSKFYGGSIPQDWVDAYQWKVEPTAGPYALASFEKDESLTFKKVKDWWGYTYDYNKYRFNLDTVVYKVITGGDEVVKNYFYKAQLDQFAMVRPPVWAAESVAEAVKKGYVGLQWFYFVPSQGLTGIVLNTKAPIFADVNVRRGLYYAVNVQKMIDTALRGEYTRMHNIGVGHVFAGVNFDDDTIRKPAFDPAKAAELFAKAGYTARGTDGILKDAKGNRLSFELLYQSSSQTDRIAVLREEARKCGLEINLKLQQQGLFEAVLEKKYEAWWGGMSSSLQPDYWQYFHSDNADQTQTNNFWGYANPEMDKLLDAFRAEGDLKKKAALDQKIQALVDRDALVIPNYYVPFYRGGSWKWIQYPSWLGMKYDEGYYAVFESGYGSPMGYQWFDPAIKKEVTDAQKAGKALPPVLTKVETFKVQ